MQQTAPAPVPASVRITWSGLTVEHHLQGLFQNFSYAVPDGTVVGVVGPASESLQAALAALVGRYTPIRGTVAIVGAPTAVALLTPTAAGTAGDDPKQKVGEAVLEVARVPKGSRKAEYTEWSLGAAGLGGYEERVVGDLGVGERLRLGLAMAAAAGASVVALDVSPVAGEASTGDLMMLLRQLANGGRVVLVGAPAPHELMDLVLNVPVGQEVLQP